MSRSTRPRDVPTDAHGQINEACATLNKLNALWTDLWNQQFDPPPHKEHDDIAERVHTGPPSSQLLHTGTPTLFQRYYLDVQHAVRDAWQTCGGTWHTDHHSTLPPPAMRRVTRLLAARLADDQLAASTAVKACRQVMGGWNALPEGLRGEPKGGGRQCEIANCTDPAERGKRQCNRHAYVKRYCARDGCDRELRQTDSKACAACRKRDQRQRGAA